MTFTFNTTTPTDRDRVRLAIGDIDSTAPKLTDEVIAMLISEEATWQKAAIAAVKTLIAQLLIPDFTADWLKVDASTAVKGYERLLARLQAEYDVTVTTVKTKLPIAIGADDTTRDVEYTT